MIRWGSSSFRPSNGQGQGINPSKRQNILSPLEDRIPQGLVWGSQIVNVQKGEGVSPEPPFNPMSISGLQVWLDADDESTLTTYTSGSEVIVSGWTSKGNWTGTLSAETETRAPRFITDGGEGSSKAVYLYSGASTSNNSGLIYRSNDLTFDLNSGVTMFIFSKTRQIRTETQSWTGPKNLNIGQFTGGTNTTYGQSTINFTNTTLNVYNPTTTTTGYLWSNTDAANSVAYRNITPYFLRSSSIGSDGSNLNGIGYNLIEQKYTSPSLNRINESSTFSSRTINQVGLNTTWTTSSVVYGTSWNNPEEVYEVLVYDRELTESEYNQVRQYLLNKWDYTVNIPTGYTEVDVVYSDSNPYGNYGNSLFWVVDDPFNSTQWFRITNEFSGTSKSYFIDINSPIRFRWLLTSYLTQYLNVDVYSNGQLFDRLYNVPSLAQSVNTSDNLVNIPEPITVSAYTTQTLVENTIYINFTGTSATGLLRIFSGDTNGGDLIYQVGGIVTSNGSINFQYQYNSTFYIEYSDSESKGNFTEAELLNNCDQNNIKEYLTNASGDNWNFLLTNLNPGYCLKINSVGTP